MADTTWNEENTSPTQHHPFFSDPTAVRKRGRTYARPKEPKKTRRRSSSSGGGGVGSGSFGGSSGSRGGGASGTAKKRKKSSSSRRRIRSDTGGKIGGGGSSNSIPRCALQTLGGRDPAKGGLVKAKSNEATLKKMRGYGGAMFYDKCYLSSDEDDEEGAVEESSLPWALSPPAYGGGDFLDAADEVIPFPGDGKKPKSKRVNKKNSAVAAAVTSKKRPLVSSARKRRSSSSSRDGPFSMEEAADDDSSPDEVGGSTGGSIHASERETAAPSKTSKAARTKSSSIPTPPVRARSTSTASAGALEKALGKANKPSRSADSGTKTPASAKSSAVRGKGIQK